MTTTPETKNPLIPDGYMVDKVHLLLSTITIGLLSLALPIMTLQVYDRILPNPQSGTFYILLTVTAIAAIMEASLRMARSYITGWAGASYQHRQNCNTLKKILYSQIDSFRQNKPSDYLACLNNISKIKDFHSGYAHIVLIELGFVGLYFTLLIYIGGTIALVPFVILGIFSAITLSMGKILINRLAVREQCDENRYSFFLSALEGIHSVKAFALEKLFVRRFEAQEREAGLANYHVSGQIALIFNLGASLNSILMIAVITAGALLVLNGALTGGGMIACILISGRMTMPIQKALALWVQYQDNKIAEKQIIETMALPQVNYGDQSIERDSLVKFQLQNISFRHQEKQITDNVNHSFFVGETVSITADDSASQTTFLRMLQGIYPPQKGTVLINDTSINDIAPEQLSHHIGYLGPETVIFRGTIRDNLTSFGQIDKEAVNQVCRHLKLDQIIAGLPQGFDTILQENTVGKIPPGLKQKIALARVLSYKPKIILYDNADTALDHDGYEALYHLLARIKGQTLMILATHDANIQRLADQHFTLENGKLLKTASQKKSNIIDLKKVAQGGQS